MSEETTESEEATCLIPPVTQTKGRGSTACEDTEWKTDVAANRDYGMLLSFAQTAVNMLDLEGYELLAANLAEFIDRSEEAPQ